MILERLDAVSDRVFRTMASCTLKWTRKKTVADGAAEVLPTTPSKSGLYRAVLRWQEKSFWLRTEKWIFGRILESNVSDIGLFLVAWGVVSLGGNWLFRHAAPFSMRMLLPVAQILSASVLLRSDQSVSRCIRHSRMLRWLLFSFCRLSEVGFKAKPRAGGHRVGFLIGGVLIGLLSVLLSPLTVGILLLSVLLLALLSAVPEAALTALLFLLPFCNLTAHPTVTLCVLAFLCTAVCFGKAISGKRQVRWERADGLVLWLCALFVMGGIVSYGSAYDGCLRAFLLFGAWFPTRLLLSSKEWRSRECSALAVSSFLCAVGGILEYVLGKAELAWVDVSRFGDLGGRVCGSFGNPNLFAIFLLLTVPFSLKAAFTEENNLQKTIAFGMFLTGSLCLVLTWSRGAWLAWMLSVLLFLALCSRRSFSVLIAGSVGAVGLLFYLPQTVVRRFRSIGSLTDSSANYRIHTWRGVLRMIRANPWGIGCGEEAFHRVFPIYAVSGTEQVMHPHQILLQVLAELGLAGGLLFAVLMGMLFWRIVRFCRNTPEGARRAEGVVLFSILAGVLLMGCFDSLWYHNGLFWLFWVLCAMHKNRMSEENV